MRGRKPKPTAEKLLHNNPGHRPLNENEPKHPSLNPDDIPEQIQNNPSARQRWEEIAPTLVERGHVTVVDRDTLIGYCVKYAQWRRLEDLSFGKPEVIAAPSGYPMPNPLISMANKAFVLMLKAAAELGITPSSRTRVVADRTERGGDSFARGQAAHPRSRFRETEDDETDAADENVEEPKVH